MIGDEPTGVHGEALAALETLRRDLATITLPTPMYAEVLTLLDPFRQALDALESMLRTDWEHRIHEARNHRPIMMPNGDIR